MQLLVAIDFHSKKKKYIYYGSQWLMSTILFYMDWVILLERSF